MAFGFRIRAFTCARAPALAAIAAVVGLLACVVGAPAAPEATPAPTTATSSATSCGSTPGFIVGTPDGPLCITYAVSTAGGAGGRPLAVLADRRMRLDASETPHADDVSFGLNALAASVSREIAGPVVAIGRPGAFGSTTIPSAAARFADRITPATPARFSSRIEVTAVSLVLDRLKAEKGYLGFHLVGIGNGGNLAATLAARRDDIGCAVLADASLSERDRLAATGALFVPAELKAANDPIAEIATLPERPSLHFVALSDPGDSDTPSAATDAFVRAVTARHVAIDRLNLPGPIASSTIARFARLAAKGCIAGEPARAIEAEFATAFAPPTIPLAPKPQVHTARPSVPPFDETFAALEPTRLPPETPSPSLLAAPTHFSRTDLIFGTPADSVTCAALPYAVWVTSTGSPECIRYYYSEAGGHGDRALVFLNGDFTYRGHDGLAAVDPAYGRIGPADLRRVAETRSRDYGGPMIYLARPGTLGSSGQELSVRHSPREVALVMAAMDEIKRRHGIATFDLVGHSGGGLLVGAMVAERHDIGCAVTSSGVLAARAWSREKLAADPGAVSYLYDPLDHVSAIRPGPDFRYILLTDPADTTVSAASTKLYLDALQKTGVPFTHIDLAAADEAHHDLALHGFRAAIACAHGATDAEIRTLLTRTVVTNRHMSELGELGDMPPDPVAPKAPISPVPMAP